MIDRFGQFVGLQNQVGGKLLAVCVRNLIEFQWIVGGLVQFGWP